jgi:ATP-dependent DNA helicase DinG
MTRKEANYVNMGARIQEILADNYGVKSLVHTVSYDWNDLLYRTLLPVFGKKYLFTYDHAQGRQTAINNFNTASKGVLLAPSLERGIDLPYDACRLVLVTKVPFPYLGDKQVSARLYSKGGQSWYNTETIRSLIQMSGRGVRAADDFALTYILDKQFLTNIWKRSRHLLPGWYTEALIWDKTQTPSLSSY